MAYQDIQEEQGFTTDVHKIEITDLVHADLMNEIISQLLTNEVFLKNEKADVESPEFTGTPTAPTAPESDNSARIATTAFVKAVINAVIGGAPETLDTLKEIADAIAQNETVMDALNAAIGSKVDKAEGKGLSTNDYTDEDKDKLAGLGVARTIDGVSFDGSGDITHYGTCSTAAGTAAKTVSITGFNLATGAVVEVLFSNANTAASPTLNVNGTGAKTVYYNGAALTASNAKILSGCCIFVYDGSRWRLAGNHTMVKGDSESAYRQDLVNITKSNIGLGNVANERQYSASNPQPSVTGSSGSCAGNAATATKLQTARLIDGVSFDGSGDITHYGTCSTAAGTAEKKVDCPGFSLVTGAKIDVKFFLTSTANFPKLNVNGTGAKDIYNGSAYGGMKGVIRENRTYTFRYTGAQWDLVGEAGTGVWLAEETVAGELLGKVLYRKVFIYSWNVTSYGINTAHDETIGQINTSYSIFRMYGIEKRPSGSQTPIVFNNPISGNTNFDNTVIIDPTGNIIVRNGWEAGTGAFKIVLCVEYVKEDLFA